jgi:hypothetical protein
MSDVFKILNGMERVDEGKCSKRNEEYCREHPVKLYKRWFILNATKFSFASRVCDQGNKLPQDIVTASSVTIFKTRYDYYTRNKGRLKHLVKLFLLTSR